MVALNQACDGQRWYTSTKELQLASLQFCVACRNVTTLHLRVDLSIPRRLLAAADARSPDWREGRGSTTRVPRLRARAVTWNISSSVKLDSALYALTEVEVFEFGRSFYGSIEDVAWPRRLRVLQFRNNFDEPVVDISWPPSLRRLEFGFEFDQPVDRVTWPPCLQQLTFGFEFDQPVVGVSWPPSLRQLTFGHCFNQPVDGVSWPPFLRQLTFGTCFDQAVEGVAWPSSLQKLKFGRRFNQPVARVAWPASLEALTFGDCREDFSAFWSNFNQAIDEAAWPASLRRLTLGGSFEQSLLGLGGWMPYLEELTILNDTAWSSNGMILVGIEWPRGLKQLRMGTAGKGLGNKLVIPPTVEVFSVDLFCFSSY